jgi:hypothetical protein
MDEKEYGVHKQHCCVVHGCKYGDEFCPVVEGKIKQNHPCMDCEEDGMTTMEILKKLEENPDQWQTIMGIEVIDCCSTCEHGNGAYDEYEDCKFITAAKKHQSYDLLKWNKCRLFMRRK